VQKLDAAAAAADAALTAHLRVQADALAALLA
jgi:hypothetical protein